MTQAKGTIHAALGSFKKPELDDIKHFIGARVARGKSKAEYVDNLTAYIIQKPRIWLSKMLERDLRLLKVLVDKGPGVPLYTDYPDYPSVLETIRLIDSDASDDNFRKLSISQELYNIVEPCIDSVLARNEINGRFRMERLALGCLNIYGVLPFEDFVGFLWDGLQDMFPDGNVDKFQNMVYDMPLVKISIYNGDDGCMYIASPCVSDPEKLRHQMESEFDEVQDYRIYSYEDVLASGCDAPVFVFGRNTIEGMAVHDMLFALGYTEEEIRLEMHDMWMNSQYVIDDKSTEALLSSVNRKQDEIPSFEKYAESMQIVAAYANHLPKWLLKGNNSEDVNFLKVVLKFDSHNPEPFYSDDTVEEGPEPFTLPDLTVSDGFGSGIESMFANLLNNVPHVAKDDPCPCGSGLRYRNCHGKYLS